jgi:hypothetical protein
VETLPGQSMTSVVTTCGMSYMAIIHSRTARLRSKAEPT